MIPLFVFNLLFIHWVADFVCQTDEQALGKSKNWFYLFEHVSYYAVVFSFLIYLTTGMWMDIERLVEIMSWLIVSHTIIDTVTSRINSYLWDKGQRHWFFVSVGFDQLLHYAVILKIFS